MGGFHVDTMRKVSPAGYKQGLMGGGGVFNTSSGYENNTIRSTRHTYNFVIRCNIVAVHAEEVECTRSV